MKESETKVFKEILIVLEDIKGVKNIEWNYNIAFCGFKQYLTEKAIKSIILSIDREGTGNTILAAKHAGFSKAMEVDSKQSIGVRVSDMLAGVISKLLKALHHSLRYNSSDEYLQKKLLGKEWFSLSQEQFVLYKKLYIIVCRLNDAWYKSFSGRYSDDLIILIAFLNYMNSFTSVDEINIDIDAQGEYFNSYVCKYLKDYYVRLQNKLPIDVIPSDAQDYFFNQRGAKVFFDIQCQPMLKFTNGMCRCHVLSIGVSKEGIPLATVEEIDSVNCYRLPIDLAEWAMSVVGLANMGTNLFSTDVVFTKYNDRFNADIL